jgi:hypothetical protein
VPEVYPTFGTQASFCMAWSERQNLETTPAAWFAERARHKDSVPPGLDLPSWRSLRVQRATLSFVVLVTRASFPQCPQHRENLALRGEAGMRGVMRPRQCLLVGALKRIVTAGV